MPAENPTIMRELWKFDAGGFPRALVADGYNRIAPEKVLKGIAQLDHES